MRFLLATLILIASMTQSFAYYDAPEFYEYLGESEEGLSIVHCRATQRGQEILRETSWKKVPIRGTFLKVRADEQIEKTILVNEKPGFFKNKWSQLEAGHHILTFIDKQGEDFSIIFLSSLFQNEPAVCILDLENLRNL